MHDLDLTLFNGFVLLGKVSFDLIVYPALRIRYVIYSYFKLSIKLSYLLFLFASSICQLLDHFLSLNNLLHSIFEPIFDQDMSTFVEAHAL